MKNVPYTLLIFVIVAFVAVGCTKKDTTPAVVNPDVSSFSISGGASFVAGAAASMTINSSSLGGGTFTVHYDLSAPNLASGLSAVLNMAGTSGVFSTPKLSNAGNTTLTITSITNDAGHTTNLTTGNTFKIVTTAPHDSTGLMTATIGTKPFRATDVSASLAGDLLSIDGVVWSPDLSSITLYLNHYTRTTGTTTFDDRDATSFNGNCHYGLSSSASVIAQISAYGKVTVTSVSPLLTGTFSFTNHDSSKVSGSFSVPAP